MDVLIKPSKLGGELSIPPSKSQTMRALVFATLSEGVSHIINPLPSPDTDAMVKACIALGAEIKTIPEGFAVLGTAGRLSQPCDIIDAGNSGLVLRFIGALASLIEGWTFFTGDHSIRNSRPAQPLLDGINQLGGKAFSALENGRAPFAVRGCLRPGSARMDGEDSQPVSALLIAASCLDGATEIEVVSPGEKPWIDLTLQWLEKRGAKVSHENYKFYKVQGGARYAAFDYSVPGDWSSAAFPLVAAYATRSTIVLNNVDFSEAQGDKKIVEWVRSMGGDIEYSERAKSLRIDGSVTLMGASIDVNESIDALPALAALGCFAGSPLRLTNGAIARKKESDRIFCMVKELRKLGAHLEEEEDGLTVYPSLLNGCASLESHGDHRIALALCAACLGAQGSSMVRDAGCTAKSYPNFVNAWRTVGAEVMHGK